MDRLHETLETEFLLQRRILGEGHVACLAADAVVEHETFRNRADGARANRSMKRVMAVRRATDGRWGPARRALFAAGMILSPPLHLWRLVRTLWNRPRLWGAFLAGLPVITTLSVISAHAEAEGYLLGPGRSREDLTETELSVDRET